MKLGDVMVELGSALQGINGLRVFPYSAKRVVPPAAVVGMPETYTFDATYGRGSDTLTLPLFVLVGNVDAESSRDDLSRFVDGSGAASVKAVLEAATYTSCDTVHVASVEFSVIAVAAVDYLAATFQINVTGAGSAS